MDKPTIETNNYALQLDILSDDGETDYKLNDNVRFLALDLMEIPRSLPFFCLSLNYSVSDMESISKVKNFRLNYESKTASGLKYTLTLGVNTMSLDRNLKLARYKGWACDSRHFRYPNTRYLGNGAKTALSALEVFPEDKTMEMDDVSMDFFQINECNVVSALNICSYAATTPLWYAGRTGVYLNQPTKTAEDYGVDKKTFDIFPSDFHYRPDCDYDSWKSSSKHNAYQIRESEGGERLFSLGSPNNYGFFTDAMSVRDRFLDIEEFSKSGLLIYGYTNYTGEYPLPIGTVISDSSFSIPGISGWVVGSCYYHYTLVTKLLPVSTDVQFIGKQESINA